MEVYSNSFINSAKISSNSIMNNIEWDLYRQAEKEGFEFTRWSHDGSPSNHEREFNQFKLSYLEWKKTQVEINANH